MPYSALPEPMLARPGLLSTRSGYSFEVKWDGIAAIVAARGRSGCAVAAAGTCATGSRKCSESGEAACPVGAFAGSAGGEPCALEPIRERELVRLPEVACLAGGDHYERWRGGGDARDVGESLGVCLVVRRVARAVAGGAFVDTRSAE